MVLRFVAATMLSVVASMELAAAEPSVEVLRDRVYIERESGPLAMDLYVPRGDGPFPGMLVVHGGAWHLGSRAQLATSARALAEHGYTAAAISYRLAPQHKFPAQIHDCQAAIRWLRKYASEFKIDPARIGAYGYSAGGQLVALLGALDDDDFPEQGLPANAPSARIQAVLAGGAPCDFRVLAPDSKRLAFWLGGTPATHPDAYRNASPAYFVTRDDPPMFFFHGAQDELVPIESAERMVARLTAAGVTTQMHILHGTGHIAPVFDATALQQAISFADRHLRDVPPNRPVHASRTAPDPDSTPLSDDTAKGGASHGQ